MQTSWDMSKFKFILYIYCKFGVGKLTYIIYVFWVLKMTAFKYIFIKIFYFIKKTTCWQFSVTLVKVKCENSEIIIFIYLFTYEVSVFSWFHNSLYNMFSSFLKFIEVLPTVSRNYFRKCYYQISLLVHESSSSILTL